ncbi:CCA tRNA nucleotidyltransferase [Cyanobium sp. FACHB-13342]|uniref:CCA tRNA nucleotidyltransferase n=1 Tax=Cyanobium sp. FACHB-13342 TaxID=2692793 RepID=UPI001680C924|nr:CCA tRNA nucleotidyltransferase [Cyanobium sp. FACHB-13342]MBD2423912.1 CCA tRNA nucleotidyltransferase [Cyanobium sp. FACHB-13342]
MLPRPSQEPILTGDRPAGEVAQALWQRLLAEPWPLPLEALPPGTALVGGAVRDGLLGRLEPQPDLDLVVAGDAIGLTRQLARSHGGSAVVLDADHGIARLVLGGWSIDLARRDGDSLEADLGRRDYTVNAIALPLPSDGQNPGLLVDPTGGLTHLERRELVAVSEANLLADPLRLLRGIRLACSLDFTLEPTSRGWIERHGDLLTQVAGERVLAELEKLATAPNGERGLALALACGLLRGWGVDPSAGALLADLRLDRARQRGLDATETAWALPLARLSALLPPQALADLRSSRRLQQRCRALRHWQGQLEHAGGWGGLGEAASLALHRELEADLPALLLLTPKPALPLLARWRNPDDPLLHPRPPLDGRRLQQHLAIPAGPDLGQLLDHLTLERAFGRLPADGGPQADALALAAAERWWLQKGEGGTGGRRD